ncbi:hypothetical protein QFC22_001635 [Naganishia vaughanmartiniae]|uniref:Uncharacterized protein n=1 Tax=Naganishia vaughanmartiniae TaxID=1424756 RepID=A0ACC2XHX3_9TREE|nr:hypothetical protein QFC22_001635 [Naganishia vaughanmartiniae]
MIAPYWRIPGIHEILVDPGRAAQPPVPQRSGMRLSTRTASGFKRSQVPVTSTSTPCVEIIDVTMIDDSDNDDDDIAVMGQYDRSSIAVDENIKPTTNELDIAMGSA